MLPRKLEGAAREAHGIIGFWLGYQPDENQLGADEMYEIWINVVYATDKPAYAASAATVANALSQAVIAEFLKEGRWTGIELRRCVAVSEVFQPIKRSPRNLVILSWPYGTGEAEARSRRLGAEPSAATI